MSAFRFFVIFNKERKTNNCLFRFFLNDIDTIVMLNIVFTIVIFNKERKTNNCLFRFGCNRDFHLLGEKVTSMTLTWFFW